MLNGKTPSSKLVGRIGLYFVISAMFLTITAAGANAAGFSFMDSVIEFFGFAQTQTTAPVTQTAEPISAHVVEPMSMFLTGGGSITAFGSPLTENFDGLLSTGTANTWTDNSTISGAYSDKTAYAAGTGSISTGALYSYGVAGTNPLTDRALGGLGSSGTGTIYWAFKLTNNTGSSIQALSISFNGEQWRDGGNNPPVAQPLDFQYQVGTTGTITDANVPSTGWTSVPSLVFTAPIFATTSSTLDGNAAANRTAKSATITFGTPVPNGQEIWIRWVDLNDAGADQGLAIDDLSVTANPVSFTLTVDRTGTGAGQVTSQPAGIGCGSGGVCSASFTGGSQVQLTAVGNVGSVFSGWGGDCSGTQGVIQVTMSSAKTCTATFTASQQTPTLSFTSTNPGTLVYLGTYQPTATTNSNGALSITVSPLSVCSITNGVVRMDSGTGTCTVTAQTAATAQYTAASTTQDITAAKGTQTLSFSTVPPSSLAFGRSASLNVSASPGGLAVSFSATGGACDVSPTGLVTMTSGSVGTCTVTASTAETTNYLAASVQCTISPIRESPTLQFSSPPPAELAYARTAQLQVTGSPGGTAVSFAATGGACDVSPTGLVTITSGSVGSCSVSATSPQTADYEAGSTGQFPISNIRESPTLQSTGQTSVTFSGSPQSMSVGAVAGIAGGAVAGIVVACRYDGSTTAPTNAGTYHVTCDFTPTETENYETLTDAPAGDFTIIRESPTLSFNPPPPSSLAYGKSAMLQVTGTPGGTATAFVASGGACTVTPTGTVTMTSGSIGTCTVTASIPQTQNYEAASVECTISPIRESPTLQITNAAALGNPTVTGAPVSVEFTITNSGGSPTSLPPSGVLRVVSGSTVLCTYALSGSEDGSCAFTPDVAGTYDLFVHYDGDSNYSPADSPPVSHVVLSNDASLSALTVSSGTLQPAFDPAVLEYSVTVPNSVSSITVRPSCASGVCSITVGGAPVASGVDSPPVALSVGSNVVLIRVVAQDSQTDGTYVITITRSAASVVIQGNETLAGPYDNVTFGGCFTATLSADVSITGTMTVPSCASLETNDHVVSGSGSFVLSDGGALYISSAYGITTPFSTVSCPAGADCGSIQTSSRSFSSAADYIYNGATDQIVGNALPATVHNLFVVSPPSATTATRLDGYSPQTVTGTLQITGSNSTAKKEFKGHVTLLKRPVAGQTVCTEIDSYHNVVIDAFGKLTLGCDVIVTGDWTKATGSELSGDFAVTFNGSTGEQDITGDTTFYKLQSGFIYATSPPPVPLRVSGTMTVTNKIVMFGGQSQDLSISGFGGGSGTPNDPWQLCALGERDIQHVSVSDSDATCSGPPVVATNSIDGGENHNWLFNPHRLTVSSSGSGSGTITSQPAGISCGAACSADFAQGTMVTLTAVAASNSELGAWSGDCAGQSPASCTLSMDGAKTVTKTFPRSQHVMAVTRTGGGTVTSSPAGISCGTDCDDSFDSGSVVTLTAAPDAGASFAGWTGACTGSSTTCDVTMDGAKTVSARFTFHLSVSSSSGTGSGVVTSQPAGIRCGTDPVDDDCDDDFDGGSTVTLTATASSGSTFAGWTGEPCAGLPENCGVTMSQARSVTALFTANPDTTIDTFPPPVTNQTTVTFTFSSTVTPATFECALDSTTFTACTSPAEYSNLAQGEHTFRVRARAAGAVDPSPATRTWVVDSVGPTVTITSGPADGSAVSSASATFTFTTLPLESDATFECKLDTGAVGGAFVSCSSGQTYNNLSEGTVYTFSVRALDSLGNVGPPESRSWIVDTTPPVVTIESTSPNPTTSSSSVSFSSDSDGDYSVRVGGDDCDDLDSDIIADGVYVVSPMPTVILIPPTSMLRGSNTIRVCLQDRAGNTSAAATSVHMQSCTAPDNGSGTADMPVECRLLGGPITVPWVPAGQPSEAVASLDSFTNVSRSPGGSLGGERADYAGRVRLMVRRLSSATIVPIDIPVQVCMDSGPRQTTSTDSSFDTAMCSMDGQITGDPDFDLLRIRAGSGFGLPSPGHTTLTRMAGTPDFSVDSYVDMLYTITYSGRAGGPFSGMSGSTTGTIRMKTVSGPRPYELCYTVNSLSMPDCPMAGWPVSMVTGMPPGTSMVSDVVFSSPSSVSSAPGSSLGGTRHTFLWSSSMSMHGTGDPDFDLLRTIPFSNCPVTIDEAPRAPGQPVQSFETEMLSLECQLPPGDPDFDLLRIRAGSGLGLPPSPGHTTLTCPAGSSTCSVDSFFDVFVDLDFTGKSGGRFHGRSGSTTGTIRMQMGLPSVDGEITTFTATPNPVAVGDAISFRQVITNRGNSSDSFSVTGELPVGLTFDGSSDGTCAVSTNGRTCTCTPGYMTSGSSKSTMFTAHADASLAGTDVSVTMALSGQLPDPDPTNNSKTATTHVSAQSTPTNTATSTPTPINHSITVLKVNDTTGLPMSGWTMNLYSGAGCAAPAIATQVTDSNGIVDFVGLSAGSYSVGEVNQAGWTPMSGVCKDVGLTGRPGGGGSNSGTGEFPGAGDETFPSAVSIKIEIGAAGCTSGSPTCDLTLTGPVTMHRSATCQSGEACGNGLAYYDTEMLSMSLSGTTPTGPFMIRESPTRQSLGRVTQRTAGTDYPADSFFDIFVELAMPDGSTLHATQPFHATGTYSDMSSRNNSHSAGCSPVQLFDANNQPAGTMSCLVFVPLYQDATFIVFRNQPPAPTATASSTATNTPTPSSNYCQSQIASGQPGSCSTGGAATVSDPTVTDVTIPAGAAPSSFTLTVSETNSPSPPLGFTACGQLVDIDAQGVTLSSPATLAFHIDSSACGSRPPQLMQLFRNGVQVPDCNGSNDPCVSCRTVDSNGDGLLCGTTSHFSEWLVAVEDYDIAGSVTYGNSIGLPTAPRFVPNVLLSAAGSPAVSDTTTGSGTYLLTGFGAGSYTVTPSKTGQAGSVTSFDAARIAQYVTGNASFSAAQSTVADVSGTGGISSFDAALIARYAASLGAPTGNTGTWIFSPTSNFHATVSSNIAGENYSALLMGEVSGNYTTGGLRAAVAGGPANSSAVAAPQLVTPADYDVIVPVSVSGAADKGIISYEFELSYDPSVIQPQADPVEIANTVSRGLSAVANAETAGLLRVVVYGPTPLDGNGVLLNLRFTAVGAPGSVSPLTFERMMFNEGDPRVVVTNGQVELSAAAPNQAELNGRLLTPFGAGVANSRVTLIDTAGQSRTVLSNGFGAFRFGNLQVGQTYMLSVESRGHTFSPMTVSVTGQVVTADIIAGQ